jgi:hypothetical protein
LAASPGLTPVQAPEQAPVELPALIRPSAPVVQPVSFDVPTYTPHGLPYGGEMEAPSPGPGRQGNALITSQRYDDHWCMLRVDYIQFNRQDSARSTPLTTFGVDDLLVLSTGDADLEDDAAGPRVALYLDLFHSFDLELSWFGTLEWDDLAGVSNPTNSFFSVFSDFGLAPDQGFEETDQATVHSVYYKSQLNNYELNTRFRWSHTTKPWTGAWIFGVRYVELRELLNHSTFAAEHIDPITAEVRGPAEMAYVIDVDNELVGFNFGLEAMRTVFPGLLLGAELEAGVYGNNVKSETRITATSINGVNRDKQQEGQTAFVGELNLTATYRLFGEFYLRGGYQAMYIEGISLASNNFNTTSPFVQPRPSPLRTNGDMFLSGFHFGAECQW